MSRIEYLIPANNILSHSQALIRFNTIFWSFGSGLLFWGHPVRWTLITGWICPDCGGVPRPIQQRCSSVLERVGQTISGYDRGGSSIFVFVSTDFHYGAAIFIPPLYILSRSVSPIEWAPPSDPITNNRTNGIWHILLT